MGATTPAVASSLVAGERIDEIAIKGIGVFGEKYIILLRW
jgi:hypothetical protein